MTKKPRIQRNTKLLWIHRKDIPEITKMVLKHLKYMTKQTPFPVNEEVIKDILIRSF